jgi:hypothetical protein
MFLKAGAAPIEPKTDATTYAFNLDKGKGSADGKRMVTLGNVSNDQNKSGYVLVPRGNNDKPVQVEADSNGKIWLCIGIDSGYKGTTLVFFDSIKASIIEN